MYTRMHRTRCILMLLVLIFIVPMKSNASSSFIKSFLRLAQHQHNPELDPVTIQVSPSPSPVPTKMPTGESNSDVANETCEKASRKCTILNIITGCLLPHVGNGPQGSVLLLQNDGENSLKVNITVLPVHNTFEEIELSSHQVKKANISDLGGSSSISLNTGNGECSIHMGVPVSQGNFYEQFPYASYVTPVNGVYLLFATALIIGGSWACCKLGNKGRHLGGVPYQELEMGQPESQISMNVEKTEGWDGDWDDEWDEEKAVKPLGGGNDLGNKQSNGHSSRSSDVNGWGSDWDD